MTAVKVEGNAGEAVILPGQAKIQNGTPIKLWILNSEYYALSGEARSDPEPSPCPI
jgi:hypothetical protein